MSVFDYHAKCRRVVRLAEEGLITKVQASRDLREIEEVAYKTHPDAEPDGDITYCVAFAMAEITEL